MVPNGPHVPRTIWDHFVGTLGMTKLPRSLPYSIVRCPPSLKTSGCCYARFTSPLYYLPYPGIELPTSLTITTNYYTPDPMQRPWSRPSHSLMAVRLMFTSCQTLHHAYRTASHLGASCISSPLYNPYLASCPSHVLLMTRTHPIGYDPLI